MHSNAFMHTIACMHAFMHIYYFKKWTTEHHKTTYTIENDTPQGASVLKYFVMHMHAFACMHALECIFSTVLLY